MTKQELVRDMKQFVKEESETRSSKKKCPSSFMTKSAICRYWGRAESKVNELLKGLECESSGKSEVFHTRRSGANYGAYA